MYFLLLTDTSGGILCSLKYSYPSFRFFQNSVHFLFRYFLILLSVILNGKICILKKGCPFSNALWIPFESFSFSNLSLRLSFLIKYKSPLSIFSYVVKIRTGESIPFLYQVVCHPFLPEYWPWRLLQRSSGSNERILPESKIWITSQGHL